MISRPQEKLVGKAEEADGGGGPWPPPGGPGSSGKIIFPVLSEQVLVQSNQDDRCGNDTEKNSTAPARPNIQTHCCASDTETISRTPAQEKTGTHEKTTGSDDTAEATKTRTNTGQSGLRDYKLVVKHIFPIP